MRRLIILSMFILIFISLFSSEITLNKISTIYKTDYYENCYVQNDYLYSVGYRGIEKFTSNENGSLRLIDEINLIGLLDSSFKLSNTLFITTSFSSDDINNIFYQNFYRIDLNSFSVQDSIIITDYNERILYATKTGNYLLLIKKNMQYFYFYEENSLEPICTYPVSNFYSPYFRIMNDKYLLTFEFNELDELEAIHIFDLSDIFNIEYLGELNINSDDFDGLVLPRAIPVKINDDTILLATWEKYVFFDITNPLEWQKLGEINFPDSSVTSGPTIIDSNFMVTATNYNRVILYDISDFNNPVELSYFDYDRANLEGPIINYNNFLYTPSGESGIDGFKIENNTINYNERYPKIPFLGSNRIYGHYLFAAGNYKNLFIFDISNINNPNLIKKLIIDETVIDFRVDFDNDIMIISTFNYDSKEKFLSIYDISDLLNPVLNFREQIEDFALVTMNYPKISLVFPEIKKIIGYDISNIPNLTELYSFTYNAAYGLTYLYYDHLYYKKDNNHIGVINNLFDYPQIVNEMEDTNVNSLYHTKGDFFYTLHSGYNPIIKIYSLDDPDNPEPILEIPQIFGELLYIKDNLLIVSSIGKMKIYDINENFDYYSPIKEISHPNYINQLKFYSANNTNYLLFADPTYCDIYSYNLESSNSTNENIVNTPLSLSNYPNPFNPSTTISFNLQKAGKDTKIAIYNLKGQKVRELKLTNAKIGENKIIWNGKDDSGKKVASGVYLYSLIQDGKVLKTKKMVMVK